MAAGGAAVHSAPLDPAAPLTAPPTPPRPARRPLLALVAADALCVALAVVHVLWLRDAQVLSLGVDSGLAETYQHLKVLAVTGGVAWIFGRRRQPVYAALAALFLGLLVDDVGRLHETVGEALVGVLGLVPVLGLRAQDVGEVLFLAAWVGPLALLGAAAYARSDAGSRSVARYAVAALAVLALFGVGVDAVHQILLGLDVYGLPSALTVLEEGGELVVMSVIAAATVTVAEAAATSPAPGRV